MCEDDSLLDRARRAVGGRPTPAERAATLDDRAADDPASVSAADVDELLDLLDAADALRDAAEPSPDDDEWGLDLQPMATAGYVDILGSFDADALGRDAAADRRNALETPREHGDEDVAAAAEAALSDG